MTYRIELTKAAERDLTAAPKPMLKRLDACILGLADDPLPPGVKKLRNSDGLYRLRVSDYRIIYRIEQDVLTILIVKIGHRKEVYR
ncbi:MAG: type II toxin-antitoxin system RelE/ParE family toxin [Desulfuromonadaceae bacterium]|nr:type II toxin-antitoxin system RelE/ParE family toxin [Desulfuromonadaceae bacterium]